MSRKTLNILAVALFLLCTIAMEGHGQSVELSTLLGPATDGSDASLLSINNPSQLLDEAVKPEKLSASLEIMFLLTVLTLVPAILVMTTSFTRIVVVLALLRQAIGTQQLPPSQVITGLALFMTFCVMTPTWNKINNDAIQPYVNPAEDESPISQTEAWGHARTHIRQFMINQIENTGNTEDVYLFVSFGEPDLQLREKIEQEKLQWQDVEMTSLVPAFITSELKQAFLMGFYIYLPFLIIDMVTGLRRPPGSSGRG